MKFNGFNLDDFEYFVSRDIYKKEKLKEKIESLSEDLYSNIPLNIKKNLGDPKIGKFLDSYSNFWFSIRPIQYNGAENINYNFDINKDGIRYCLNAETDASIELIKESYNKNSSTLLKAMKSASENRIWLYERELEYGPSGRYKIGKQKWNSVKPYDGSIIPDNLNGLIYKINILPHSAVRVGRSYYKDNPIATSSNLPNLLVELTESYFELFKFLNNL